MADTYAEPKPQFDSLSIVDSGKGSVTGINNSAGSAWTVGTLPSVAVFTYTHGLPFIPAYLVFADYEYGVLRRVILPSGVNLFPAAPVLNYPFTGYADAYVTDTELKVLLLTPPGIDNSGLTLNFNFYLLKERAL